MLTSMLLLFCVGGSLARPYIGPVTENENVEKVSRNVVLC